MDGDPDQDNAPAAVPISPTDRDIAIRTMIGEESDPSAMAGVASTMLNRATSGQYGGNTLSGVALAPNQFESWSTRSHQLLGIKPSDPEYQKAAQIFDGVASGLIPDPTNGATHFFAPKLQAELGRKSPSFAKGTPVSLGSSEFYAPNGPVHYSPPAVDPFSDFQTASSGAKEQSDPFADFPTSAPASGSAVPPASAPVAAAKSGDPFDEFPTTPSAPTATGKIPTDAKPGPNGLMWNANGGYDPASGELVIAGHPFKEGQASGPVAFANSMVSGVPVVGPALERGVQDVVGGIRSLVTGAPFDAARQQAQSVIDQSNQQHPVAATAGNIAGSVAGTVPLIAMAPEAFGVGGGNLLTRAVLAGGTGAAIGSADSVVRNGLSGENAERGAVVGAATGAAGPVAGAILGGAGRTVLNALSRSPAAARVVADSAANIGLNPQDISASLNRLGSAGTIADVDPSFATDTGALAARGGETTSLLKNIYKARQANADDTASQLMTQKLGPTPDFNAVKSQIENDAATKAGPLYDAGRSGATMDVTPVLANIQKQVPNASGGVKNVLNTVKSYLTDSTSTASNPTGLTVPKEDPGAILGARQALDDLMYNRDTGDAKLGPNAMRVAGQLRDQIDGIVKGNSNFAQGDEIYSQAMGVRDALQQGVDAFKRNIRPADLQRTLDTFTPEETSAFQNGARVAISDAMEQSTRGEASAAQSMFGRGTANRAKLDALFPNSSDVFDALHSEATMRNTERSILGQSVTAERQAAMKRWAAAGEPSGLSNDLMAAGEGLMAGGPMGAAAAVGGRRVVSNLIAGVRQRSADNLARGVASGLSATGPARDAFVNQLSRAAATSAAYRGISHASDLTGYLGAQIARNRLSGALTGQ